MTARQKLEAGGINLNTVLIVVGLITGGITIGKFANPIFNTPEKISSIEGNFSTMRDKFAKIETAQTVQSEALNRLAAIAESTSAAKEVQARQTAELIDIRRRLDRLESR